MTSRSTPAATSGYGYETARPNHGPADDGPVGDGRVAGDPATSDPVTSDPAAGAPMTDGPVNDGPVHDGPPTGALDHQQVPGEPGSWQPAAAPLGSTAGAGNGRAGYPTPEQDAGRQVLDIRELHETARRIAGNTERVLVGKAEVVRIALVTLLSEGHLLVEDVPGVGKTSLAKALARSIDCTVSRVQFTPDLLPSDVTGVSIYNRRTGEFEFRPGPVFANIVVGDEINRASPKTQSALLECMEEHQVTVDTHTYRLQSPFMVIATQNPVEMEGTYALPEAQRDRFTARVSIGYPDPQAELSMVDEHAGHDPLAGLRPVSDAQHINQLRWAVRSVHVSPSLRRYAVEVVAATRTLADVRLGASPRATLHLVRAARAQAALSGREYVVPDDLHAVAVPLLAHRLVLAPEAHAARRTAADVVRSVLHRVPIPQGASETAR